MLDVQGADGWAEVDRFLAEQEVPPSVAGRSRELARAAHGGQSEWDRHIISVSRRWDIERMGLVDRNVLRLALCELRRPETTPPRVAIDEAIELAREFGAEESPAFVNGVLDAVWKKWKSGEEATERRGGEATPGGGTSE